MRGETCHGVRMRIVLASESPFRRRALDVLGLPYETRPASLNEKAIRDPDPRGLTQKLSEAKARKVAAECPDAVVIAGDAVAAKNGRIFEKPRDMAEAARFLRELSGSTFQFVTALTVLDARAEKMLSAVETSDIQFRELTDREIADYIARYRVLNYAGAFESDAVLRFADRICGSYNFVTALPVSRLVSFLREQGVAL